MLNSLATDIEPRNGAVSVIDALLVPGP